MRKRIFAALLAAAFVGLAALPGAADPKFEEFIQSLWPRAKAAGISRPVFDQAFAGITDPDPDVLKLADNQPEFTSTTSQYLVKAVTEARIDNGREMKVKQADTLAAIEKHYHVDRHVLLAIWGIESDFGRDKGTMKVMRSLATLLYSSNQKDYAREQIIAALKILQIGAVTPANFTGSWAGATGHTQFIPTSYLSYAVDWTGDGSKDIWGSISDALASTANYLAKAGWKDDRPWGWEVTLPAGFDKGLIGRWKWQPVSEWAKLGVKPARGGNFGVHKHVLQFHARLHADGLKPVARAPVAGSSPPSRTSTPASAPGTAPPRSTATPATSAASRST